jgi:hypothetical protein
MRAVQERLLAGCPAGRDVVSDAERGPAATPAHRYSELARCGLNGGCDPEVVLPLPADLAAVQRERIEAWPVRCREFMVRLAPRATSSA